MESESVEQFKQSARVCDRRQIDKPCCREMCSYICITAIPRKTIRSSQSAWRTKTHAPSQK